MRIIKDRVFRITNHRYVFAVYAWVNGDYHFYYASDNFYDADDFFRRISVERAFIAKIYYDELPQNYKVLLVG